MEPWIPLSLATAYRRIASLPPPSDYSYVVVCFGETPRLDFELDSPLRRLYANRRSGWYWRFIDLVDDARCQFTCVYRSCRRYKKLHETWPFPWQDRIEQDRVSWSGNRDGLKIRLGMKEKRRRASNGAVTVARNQRQFAGIEWKLTGLTGVFEMRKGKEAS